MHAVGLRRSNFGRQVRTLYARLYGKLDGFATDLVFRSQWTTSNTSAGSTTSTQVKLPLISTGSYPTKGGGRPR